MLESHLIGQHENERARDTTKGAESANSKPKDNAESVPMADDATNDLPPRFIFGGKNIALGEQLGHGANGYVYEAVLSDTNEAVAVKDVFTEDDKNTVASCRSLCKKLITLHSDYIVRFIGMVEIPKHFYFITELATGGSLMQALQSHPKRDDLATLLRWALDIVSGLAYLHSQQPRVLHLDIKPQNVVLFGCGLAKLCDFDISQVTEHTQTAAREGATYRYAAPEQLRDGGKVSTATDIYGLGGVLYVMALKKEPWYDIRKTLEIVHRHEAQEVVPIPSPLPPDCHACILAIAAECLHRNKEDRPTLEQVQQKLRSLLCDAEGARMSNAPPNAAAAVLEEQLPKAIAERARDNANQEASSIGECPNSASQPLLLTRDPGDTTLYNIRRLFAIGGSFQTPNQQMFGFHLRSVDIVRNDNLENSSKTHAERLKRLREENPLMFHHKCEDEKQQDVLDILNALFHPVLPAARRGPRTLTVYHGCRASAARKIVNSGFFDLAMMDAGFFGRGIYVTPNAEYACQYATGCFAAKEAHSKEHPNWFPVLLCTAVVGHVYPVTRQIDYQSSSGHSSLFGKPLKTGYDAHFALVHHMNNYEAAQEPDTAQYGELCVSQYAALLPLAILWVSPTS